MGKMGKQNGHAVSAIGLRGSMEMIEIDILEKEVERLEESKGELLGRYDFGVAVGKIEATKRHLEHLKEIRKKIDFFFACHEFKYAKLQAHIRKEIRNELKAELFGEEG